MEPFPSRPSIPALLVMLPVFSHLHAAQVQVTEPISVSSQGILGDADSSPGGVSTDGRYVVFSSRARNLVPGDTNGYEDVFLRDRLLGLTLRISVGTSGQETDGPSTTATCSPDGRFAVFVSSATNLVSGDTNSVDDVFLADLVASTMERVSLTWTGAEANGHSGLGVLDNVPPSVSDDGRFVAFCSYADNLVPGDGNGTSDVFVRDRVLGTTELVSVSTGGIQGNGYSGPIVRDLLGPAMSADGRFVVFSSEADNLVAGDVNSVSDVFLRDRQLGTTVRVSETPSGIGGNGFSFSPVISLDAKYVLFLSDATNLGVVTGAPGRNIQRWEVSSGAFEVANLDSNGVSSPTAYQNGVAGDGESVIFTSFDGALVEPPLGVGWQYYVHDCQSGVTRVASISPTGHPQGTLAWTRPNCCTLSPDGRYALFDTPGSLVSQDQDASDDVYLHDLQTGGPSLNAGNVVAGQSATVSVSGATPGARVLVAASIAGQGPVAVPWGFLHVSPPFSYTVLQADTTGSVTGSVTIPPGLAGASLWLHGADLATRYPTTIFHAIIQ